MKREYKLILAGFATIAVFDAISSIASREFDLSYTYVAIISCLIYGSFGYLGTKGSKIEKGLTIAAMAGLFDATAGWAICVFFKAKTGIVYFDFTPMNLVFTIVFDIVLAAFCGLVGGGIAMVLKKHKRTEVETYIN
ncbi:MAG: hypothetical protein V4594_24165 [Bacteroidota bacterium]